MGFHHRTVNFPHTIGRPPLPRHNEILRCGSYTPKLPTGGQNITVLTREERGAYFFQLRQISKLSDGEMPSDVDTIVEKCSFIYVRKIGRRDMGQMRQRKGGKCGGGMEDREEMTVI